LCGWWEVVINGKGKSRKGEGAFLERGRRRIRKDLEGLIGITK
jgi:hypothetical protein